MKVIYWIAAILTLYMASCQNSASSAGGMDKGGPNAEAVHNPVSANQPVDTNQFARIRFDEPDFNFGTVNEGEKVEHVFYFTNTGKIPLLIATASSSCGCTVPEWPKDPIPPGGRGELRATFNTAGRDGEQKKLIKVLSNAYPNETKLMVRGIVNPEN